LASPGALAREIRQTRPFVSARHEAGLGLLRTVDLLRRHGAPLFARAGVTAQQYNVLRILRGAGADGLPTLEIGERMVEQAPGITRLIDRLERKGLVRRRRCRSDRRQVFCHIAPAGLELLGALEKPVRDAGEAALSALSDSQVTRLIRMLDTLRAGLSGARPTKP